MTAFGLVSKGLVAASLLGMLAACSTADTKNALGLGATQTAAPQPAVVQGNCPRIVLRDGTAYHDAYVGGTKAQPDGTMDQAKLMYQASIANTTRQCRLEGGQMVITVQVAGRIVLGQAGAKGNAKLPIRVAVTDGDKVLYSELVPFEAPLPTTEPAGQFLFSKDNVTIPAGADTAMIYVGFDNGTDKANTKKKKK
ncbi:hypothetical protein [Rhizobium sp. C4]|uniref:hypothetical protein n=1 Tax=Rhizobium sp. C4 TaxID=1349800 RepID=UPI001E2A3013|nr:hypothetical protein [Rhizobium sp. C4]MCD2173021.1 hypothetical protein [Rhizobium sp. C4]